MFNSSMPSLADIAAVTNNNDGIGGNNGWWVLIILFALFGGWGRGGYYGSDGGNGGGGYYSEVQRSFDNSAVINKLNGLENGFCSLGYDQLAQMNGINANISTLGQNIQMAMNQNAITNMQDQFALQNSISNCCCENREAIAQVRYDMATNHCATQTAISNAVQTVMQNCNANYRQLHDEMVAAQMAAKDETIAQLRAEANRRDIFESNAQQTAIVLNAMHPTPVPAFQVPNPYASYGLPGSCCNQLG